MKLFVLRHGIAVERGAEGYEDSARPLTPKGERKMYKAARGMLRLGFSFDCILSSPYERAKRTAEIVAEVFKKKDILVFTDELAMGGDEAGAIEQIQQRFADRKKILLVGHEPYLGHLVSFLLTGEKNLPIILKKGSLCRLDVDVLKAGQCATFDLLLTPKVLAKISE